MWKQKEYQKYVMDNNPELSLWGKLAISSNMPIPILSCYAAM